MTSRVARINVDRRRTALLVVDMQHQVLEGLWQRDRLVARVCQLVHAAREAHIPIIWVQHTDHDLPEGSAAWCLAAGLVRHHDEPLVLKAYDDAFSGTSLPTVCADLDLTSLFICGARSDRCVAATFVGASARGLAATLVVDAHSTVDRCVSFGDHAPSTLVPAQHIVAWQNHCALVGNPGAHGTDACSATDVVAFFGQPNT